LSSITVPVYISISNARKCPNIPVAMCFTLLNYC
jgi:hypothetical protein